MCRKAYSGKDVRWFSLNSRVSSLESLNREIERERLILLYLNTVLFLNIIIGKFGFIRYHHGKSIDSAPPIYEYN